MIIFLVILLIFYITYDINYFVRTYFTVLSGRVYQRMCSLNDVTTIYGLCTLQDCDVSFKYIRMARLVRELDFARYHFYDRTGLYRRRNVLGIRSLQGCTLTLSFEPVPLFAFYKIITKLVYWDDKSLFFEHEVVTIRDAKVRSLLVSRQHAVGDVADTTAALLMGLDGSQTRPECPNYIQCWLNSMKISSDKLRAK